LSEKNIGIAASQTSLKSMVFRTLAPSRVFILLIALVTLSLPTSEMLAGPSISIKETEEALTILQDSKPILQYNKAVQIAPDGMDPIHNRSGYIHPVFTPSGQVASGDFSEDHAHQRGVFMAGTNTKFRGKKVDFWNLHNKLGRTEHAKTLSTGSSSDSASFTVQINHVATDKGIETVVLHEKWTVTGRQGSATHFVFDIESEQTPATDSPLLFNEYHYGGMALRGSNLWTPLRSNPDGTCEFLTSNGHERIEGNHTRVRWVSMRGVVDGKPASITALCHPSNFRFPQSVRLHPRMPYFTYAPMFDGEFTIEPGDSYQSRYRYLVTSSNPDADWIEKQWGAYTE